MARTVHCIKLNKEAEGLDFPPYPGELGKKIYLSVSKEAWAAWLKHQTMLVNENRLNLADQRARKYLATDGTEMNWVMIRAIQASVADLAIVPLQDILGLGSEARMNLPARASGNWQWRYSSGQLTAGIADRLRDIVLTYDRESAPL